MRIVLDIKERKEFFVGINLWWFCKPSKTNKILSTLGLDTFFAFGWDFEIGIIFEVMILLCDLFLPEFTVSI